MTERRNLGHGVEVQPSGAEATAPERLEATAQLSLLLPYVYRIDRPAPHRPEGEFMMSYGTWDTTPAPITTVEHAATYAAAQARILHSYYGPMTVRVWAHRGDAEHYREEPPASAYVLELGDQTDTINPNTKALVAKNHADGVYDAEKAAMHNPVWSLCVPCHGTKARPTLTEAEAIEKAREVWPEAEGFELTFGGWTFRVGAGYASVTTLGTVARDPQGTRAHALRFMTEESPEVTGTGDLGTSG